MTTTCPECSSEFSVPEGTVEGEVVTCPDCRAELEVASVDPVQLLAPEVSEDWGE